MAPGLVIFDCDGVLVDSEPIANRILAQALTAQGLATTAEDCARDFVGLSMASVLERAEAKLGRPLPEDFLPSVQRETFAAFRRELRPVAGITMALDRIKVPVCVASSGEPEKIELSLGVTGLLTRFKGRIFSASEVPRGKPHPDLFLLAARAMGRHAEDCAVVEDSVPGVLAARAARMHALGYAPAGRTPKDLGERLSAAGAVVFPEMAALPRLLERLDATDP